MRVRDLSDVFTRLVEEAAKGGGTATWDPGGYCFVESGGITWGEFTTPIARIAAKKGLIQSAEVDRRCIRSPSSCGATTRGLRRCGLGRYLAGMLEEAIQNWRWNPGTDVAKPDLPKGTEELLANA